MTKARLRILETTDLHMHLTGFDYLTGQPSATRGLSNLAPLIAAARSEVHDTLLFDNGDFLQGNPLADYIVAHVDGDHPMISAMNLLEYDAITLGNHEFDYGLDYLTKTLSNAQMPVVCANLRSGQQDTLYPPWTILTRDVSCEDGQIHVLKVGVIGFVTPQTIEWDAHLLNGRLIADDIVDAARTYLPQLRRAGADIVIALCHAGISSQAPYKGMENAVVPLAALAGIDVILAGHTHGLFPHATFDHIDSADIPRGTLQGKPTLMAGAYGNTLGVIDLDLRFTPDGWIIEDHQTSLRQPAAETQNDPIGAAIANSIATPQAETLAMLKRPVSETPRRLTSYLAVAGHDDTSTLLGHAKMAHVRNELKDTEYRDIPVLAATATFRAGGYGGPANYCDLPAGSLTQGDVSAIAPFNNPVCAVLRRGWQVRQWLERSCAYFTTLMTQDSPQSLVQPHIAPYHFDTIHGLRYRIDLRVPPRIDGQGAGEINRARDVTYDGLPVQDDALFMVATSSYRAYGGGGLVHAGAGDVVYTSPVGLTTILRNYLGVTPISKGRPENPWQFVPSQGAIMTFQTSPRVAGVLAEHTDRLNLELRGLRDDGFREMALHL